MSQDTPSAAINELNDFKQRLEILQAKYRALDEFARLESVPPEDLSAMQEQLMDLETRMNEYLLEFVSVPAIFWQAVRWGGLGLLLGILIGRWLAS
ncbi:MAG: hypothetical protein AAFY15_00785 [Cyanobacteria bacterium J06648_11]